MMQTRASALFAFEAIWALFDAKPREVSAWEEGCLLEALLAITSGDNDGAVARVVDSQRSPTPAEVSSILRRKLLTRAAIRDRLNDPVGEHPAQWKGVPGRPRMGPPVAH